MQFRKYQEFRIQNVKPDLKAKFAEGDFVTVVPFGPETRKQDHSDMPHHGLTSKM
jgi:hypothetical protein